MKITRSANAKINLSLDLTGTLPDGYHSIYTVMQSVSLCDTVSAENGDPGITLVCDRTEIPTDSRNTVYKAAKEYYERISEEPRIKIEIIKRIPSEAGLGGGSADAAAALKILNEFHGFKLPEEEMLKIALKIGADVPFCYLGGTRLCLNKGEVLAKLEPFAAKVLIAKPETGVSTASAYKKFDSAPSLKHPDNDLLLYYFALGEPKKALNYCGNIFEQLTGLEEGESIKRKMTENGAYFASMSGSGSAFFGLFDRSPDAEKAYDELKKTDCFVCLCDTADTGID